jgi:alcohol dehydrogenase (cytochrome c)
MRYTQTQFDESKRSRIRFSDSRSTARTTARLAARLSRSKNLRQQLLGVSWRGWRGRRARALDRDAFTQSKRCRTSGVDHSGIRARGMPAFNLPTQDTNDLVAYLRTLRAPRFGFVPVRKKVETTDGQTIEGTVIGESSLDLSSRTDDSRIHLFRTTTGGRYRPVTSQTDWATYNGDTGGNRLTQLSQIAPSNIAKLALQWVFTLSNVPQLETTPVVVEGIMYATSGNECYAIDAGNGRMLWHFQRPRTQGLVGNAAGGFNRGVAHAGDRVFMVTDNAHVLALNRFTGKLEWETEMADWHLNYNATSAPMAVGNL